MQRNKFGMNFDSGIPLTDENDFKLLYVEGNSEAYNKLKMWIEDRKNCAILGGQIGSGKTTIVAKAFFETKINPEITFHFDREGINQTTGDFLRILLAELIDFAIKNSIDLPENGLPKYLLEIEKDDWHKLLYVLKPEEKTMSSIIKKKEISSRLDNGDSIELVKSMLTLIVHSKNPFMFISGIDKFPTNSPAYFYLKDVLKIFTDFNVLFEANAVHCFNNDDWLINAEKIMIFTMSESEIFSILEKRLGKYKLARTNILSLLTTWSGGNPRQAIRLLTYFESWFKHFEGDAAKALEFSLKNTINDYFSFSKKPKDELFNAISKDNFIRSSLISLPMDKETATMAVYNNWIILNGTPDGDKLPAKINSLAKFLVPIKLYSEEPEIKALKKYAEKTGISPFGLDFNKDVEKSLYEQISPIAEDAVPLNIIEILDVISAALLSKTRADRVIIGYENERNREIVSRYLFAKSNSYEFQEMVEIRLEKEFKETLLEKLTDQSKIYSFVFPDNVDEKDIEKIDSVRDFLLNFQTIWWIPVKSLKKYLSKWTQLRQLFQIFILEEELNKSLKVEDIVSDLKFMEDLVKAENTAEDNYVKNLKIVLEYLREAHNG